MGAWSVAREGLTCAFTADREMDRETLIANAYVSFWRRLENVLYGFAGC